MAEFLAEVFETLRKRFNVAFAEADAYAKIEKAWDERSELRARVKALEKWMQDNGNLDKIP